MHPFCFFACTYLTLHGAQSLSIPLTLGTVLKTNREVSLFRGRFCLAERTVPDLQMNDLCFYLIIDFYNSIGIIGRKYLIRWATRIKE